MSAVVVVVPGPPVGKGRPRAFAIKKGARAGQIAMHTPAKTRTYEALVQGRAIEAMGTRPPMTCPVLLTIEAFFPIPESWPAWKRAAALADEIRPTTKPDFDNIMKVLDAFNGVVWIDDSRVVSARMRKVYSEVPRLEIKVEPIPAQACQQAERPRAAPRPTTGALL